MNKNQFIFMFYRIDNTSNQYDALKTVLKDRQI